MDLERTYCSELTLEITQELSALIRSSCLHNGISYTGKMVSLYWINPMVIVAMRDDSTIYILNHFQENLNIFVFSIILQNRDGSSTIKIRPHGKQGPHHLQNQCHCCWCPGSLRHQGIIRSQGINSYGIDLFLHLRFCIASVREILHAY